MNVPWLSDRPDLWNTVELGGNAIPGICKVSVDISEKIDVKEPAGFHGAKTTRQGASPAKITISVQLWNSDQLSKWSKILRDIRPDPRKKDGSNLNINHPKTDIYGIRAVLIQSIKDGPNSDNSTYEFTIECLEFFPATKSATKTEKTLDPRKQVLSKTDLPNAPVKPGKNNVSAE